MTSEKCWINKFISSTNKLQERKKKDEEPIDEETLSHHCSVQTLPETRFE